MLHVFCIENFINVIFHGKQTFRLTLSLIVGMKHSGSLLLVPINFEKIDFFPICTLFTVFHGLVKNVAVLIIGINFSRCNDKIE